MNRLIAALAAAALMLPSLALAKKPNYKKASDAELIEWLASDNEDVREGAAEMLGDRDVEDAIPALTKLAIEDKESDVYVQAMWALEEIDTDASWDALQTVFETPEATEDIRRKSLKKLMAKKSERADNGVPYYLLYYKDNSKEFNVQLLKALMKLERKDMRDLPMLIVRDARQKRPVRVAALNAIEYLKHPGAVEAYLALLDDNDKKMKMRCIKGLSRAGLPADRVGPPLEEVVRTDKQGDVRAAALNALKMYVYPELLALVTPLVTSEKHPMAWSNSLDIFTVLADRSSIPTVQRLLGPDMFVSDGQITAVIHATVRIGDPVVVPALEGLRDRTESPEVAAECKNAIRLLSPEAEKERITVIETYTLPSVVIYDSSTVSYTGAEVSMTVSDSGTIVTADGADVSAGISLGGFYAEANVGHTSATASVGGVSVSASTGTSVVVTETTVVNEGTCEPGELVVGQADKAWYNLYVDGQLKIEARAFDDSKRVGGLEAGQYHVKVNQFMDNETWSEGLLKIGCGESIKAEVYDGKGLRVLNYPDHYSKQ
jgi:HEAT repeat protein